jgi:hypothetical protein
MSIACEKRARPMALAPLLCASAIEQAEELAQLVQWAR